MKKLSLFGFLVLLCNFAIGQRLVDRDPSYSVHNYKHPNKAAYARLHNLDHLIGLESTFVNAPVNYKQPYNTVVVERAGVEARKMDKSTKSYKHPMGL